MSEDRLRQVVYGDTLDYWVGEVFRLQALHARSGPPLAPDALQRWEALAGDIRMAQTRVDDILRRLAMQAHYHGSHERVLRGGA